MWETVSAFANTAGGVIVLGVSERRDDGSFIVHGIPKAEKVLDDLLSSSAFRAAVASFPDRSTTSTFSPFDVTTCFRAGRSCSTAAASEPETPRR